MSNAILKNQIPYFCEKDIKYMTDDKREGKNIRYMNDDKGERKNIRYMTGDKSERKQKIKKRRNV